VGEGGIAEKVGRIHDNPNFWHTISFRGGKTA